MSVEAHHSQGRLLSLLSLVVGGEQMSQGEGPALNCPLDEVFVSGGNRSLEKELSPGLAQLGPWSRDAQS